MALYKIKKGSVSGKKAGETVELSDKDYSILKNDTALELEPAGQAAKEPEPKPESEPKKLQKPSHGKGNSDS